VGDNHQKNKSHLTVESHSQSHKAIKVIDNILCFTKTNIAPKIRTAFKEHASIQWK
jgi:hypothetical protein